MNATDLTQVIVQFGWFATAGIHLFAATILAWVLLLQALRRRTVKRRTYLMETWQPLLVECLLEVPESLPAIDPRDRNLFLLLWNHIQESIKGSASEQLNIVAGRIGLAELARQLLDNTGLRDRLLAITTLGRMKERSAWEQLVQLSRAENAMLSLEAVHALMRIDPALAVPLVAPSICRRKDWSPLKLMTILSEAGPHIVAAMMLRATSAAEPAILARLIRHLASTRCALALPVIRHHVESGEASDDVTAACLSYFGECSDPQDLPTIRSYLTHPTWFVRLQAAVALGKLGLPEDEILLTRLLDDSHWWVRYRAAEALTSLPSMTEEKMERLQLTLTSLEAQEILIPFMARLRIKFRAVPEI